MSGERVWVVDVFAEEKYAGNQLAVILDPGARLSDALLQKLARETNYSETTFVLADRAQDGAWPTRIFTPVEELPFAGHPTLGTAWVLQHLFQARGEKEIVLDLPVGRIPVAFDAPTDPTALLWMRQKAPQFGESVDRATVAEVLTLEEDDIDDRFPSQVVSTGTPFLVVPVRSRRALQAGRLHREVYERLIDRIAGKAIYFFCAEPIDSANQLKARLFAEALGVPEDPATGSACGCLAGWIVRHQYFGQARVDARLEQGLEIGRPSLLRLRAESLGDEIRVEVGGRVIPTLEGRLL